MVEGVYQGKKCRVFIVEELKTTRNFFPIDVIISLIRGINSFNQAYSISTALLWKLCRRDLFGPFTRNNIKKLDFKAHSLKRGKNMIHIYLKQEQFLTYRKSIKHFNVNAVEIGYFLFSMQWKLSIFF